MSERLGRYADAPPAALLTGQVAGELVREYAVGVSLRRSPIRPYFSRAAVRRRDWANTL